jgi:hypothetical protein
MITKTRLQAITSILLLCLSFSSSAATKSKAISKNKSNKSLREKKKKVDAKSPITISIGLALKKSLDEFSNASGVFSPEVDYRFDDSTILNFAINFTHKFQSEIGNNEKNGDFSDFEINLKNEKLRKIQATNTSINGAVGIVLPSSQTSQDASMRGALTGSFTLKNKFDWLTISQRNKLYIYNHQYETSNLAGTEYNEKWAVDSDLSFKINVYEFFSIIPKISFYNFYNNAGTNETIQTYQITALIEISSQTSIYALYRTVNTLSTNNSLFDDDKTSYIFGIAYSF